MAFNLVPYKEFSGPEMQITSFMTIMENKDILINILITTKIITKIKTMSLSRRSSNRRYINNSIILKTHQFINIFIKCIPSLNIVSVLCCIVGLLE